MHTTPPHTHIVFIMPLPKGNDSRHTHDNRWFSYKDSHSKSNELSSPVITVTPPLNYSFINPSQLSSVCQKSSSSSQNTTPESQAYLIPGRTSADPSNTMAPSSTKNRSCNIYGCMVDVYNLKPEQRQQNAIMLIHHYHELCNTNNPSSMFVSPTPIPNIESLSQSTISSLGSRLFGRNRYDVNIQKLTTSEVAYIETMVADNEELDTPPPQNI